MKPNAIGIVRSRPYNRSAMRSFVQRLSLLFFDHAAIVGADGTRCMHHVNNCELLFGIDPEECSTGASPHVLAFRARHPGKPRSLSNHEAESERIAIHTHQKSARCER